MKVHRGSTQTTITTTTIATEFIEHLTPHSLEKKGHGTLLKEEDEVEDEDVD